MHTQSKFRYAKPALASTAALVVLQLATPAYAAEDDKTVTA